MQKIITSWGCYPRILAEYLSPSADALSQIASVEKWIPRGLGRSYGDSALAPTVVSNQCLQHLLYFDENTGVLHAQSGVSLADIISTFLPRGWFLPVTPGTKFVTLGGAIASDVHGKNHHHVGCFSNFIDEIELLNAQGEIIFCSPKNHPEIFHATCGGMGLTGFILSAKLRLKKVPSAYISQQLIKTKSLEETCEVLQENASAEYSVAWVDCLASTRQLGRAIVLLGEHAEDASFEKSSRQAVIEVSPNSSASLVSPLLQPAAIKLFNELYYHYPRKNNSIISFEKYFYPLDRFSHWNHWYGKNGFTQYQCVVPLTEVNTMKKILEAIKNFGEASFLSVLKIFGKANQNLLSFPMEGLTLAMDFKISPKLWTFLDSLDELVINAGGRIYLTKDCRLSADHFRQMYANVDAFLEMRQQLDPRHHIQSLQAKRLAL